MGAQQVEERRGEPLRVAHFHDGAHAFRNQRQERGEAAAEVVAGFVFVRVGALGHVRELEEQRAALEAEGRQGVQKVPPLRGASFQPRRVRDRLRHLQAEHEAVWRLAGPPLDRGSRRNGVECGVDLDGREEPGVVRQVVARLRSGRVDEPRPVGRAERRGTQAQAARQGREIEVEHAVRIGVTVRGVKAAWQDSVAYKTVTSGTPTGLASQSNARACPKCSNAPVSLHRYLYCPVFLPTSPVPPRHCSCWPPPSWRIQSTRTACGQIVL